MIDKSKVKNILVIGLSNIGDSILMTPVIKALKQEFPSSGLDLMAGPRAEEIFKDDIHVRRFIVYDKHISILGNIKFSMRLKRNNYDLIVDLRNTIFPFFIGPRYRTKAPVSINAYLHKRDTHLLRLKSIGIKLEPIMPYIWITEDEKKLASGLLRRSGLKEGNRYISVCPGAMSHPKRWASDKFAEVCDRLAGEFDLKIVFLGDNSDTQYIKEIIPKMKQPSLDLSAKTTIKTLAQIIKDSLLLITNDSAALHIASATNTPTVAIFAMTDPAKYGPLAEDSFVVRADLKCSPCEKAQCPDGTLECMKAVSANEVFNCASQIIRDSGINHR